MQQPTKRSPLLQVQYHHSIESAISELFYIFLPVHLSNREILDPIKKISFSCKSEVSLLSFARIVSKIYASFLVASNRP